MRIDRSNFEEELFKFLGVTETVQDIESDLLKNISHDGSSSIHVEIEQSKRKVVIRTYSDEQIYQTDWKVNIHPSDKEINIIGLNNKKDEVMFELPPGKYEIETDVKYRTDEGEHKKTITDNIVVN